MLVAVLVPTAVLEGSFREDVIWRPVALVLAVALVFPLLWRRTHPLAAVAVAFGVTIAVTVAALFGADGPVGLDTSVFVLLLPYSLLRWGSGREAVIGLGIILVAYVLGIASDYTGLVDAALASVVLLFPAALGAAVRYRATSRLRELDQVKLREREQLARELHDTVAHHVSAIAIQAQAGRVVAPTDPDAAVDALEVIEEEASRTLAEMRSMVGVLREGEEPDLAPQRGVADIEGLADRAGDRPRVEVHLSGDLDDLGPSVEAAIYRLAQESITNAVRHARHATRIRVGVAGDHDCVRLTVRDDGDASSAGRISAGYGLVGMTERAALLGGTLRGRPEPRQRLDGQRRAAEGGLGHMTIRVLVADDQELVRTGLRMILDAQPDIEVVGEAADGREAVALARELRPDVCLFDIRMPAMDGIEATRQLAGPGVDRPARHRRHHHLRPRRVRARRPQGGRPGLPAQGRRARAAGPGDPRRRRRRRADRPRASPSGCSRRSPHGPAGRPPVQPIEPLTSREEEVLLTVARGRTNAEIADELHISLSTVKTHLASLMAKLGARNRVEIAMWAYETGRVKS